MKTKVLFLITKSNWGGAQRYVFDLATHLPKESFAVTVLSGNTGVLTEKLATAHVQTITIQNLKKNISITDELVSFFKILSIIRKEKPDVLHLNSSKAAGLGALAGRIAGVKKIIFTVHGWPFEEDRGILARSIIYTLSWFTALFSHTTITITQKDYRLGKRLPLVGSRIAYIPLGIEMRAELTREQALETLSLSQYASKKIIGSVGELTKNKGYPYALEALAKLKERGINNFAYIIIGEGEDRFLLQKKIEELALTDHVRLLGFIDGASTLMKAFDIFLFPSVKEGLPYAILEAGLAGVTVAASNVGGIPDIIENEKSGFLFEKKRSDTIANALLSLWHNNTSYGLNLKQRVQTLFPLRKMLEATIHVYRS